MVLDLFMYYTFSIVYGGVIGMVIVKSYHCMMHMCRESHDESHDECSAVT